MRSGNPVLQDSTFTDVSQRGYSRPMTLTGVINRSILLLLLVAGTAAGVWTYSSSHPSSDLPDGYDRGPWRIRGWNGNFVQAEAGRRSRLRFTRYWKACLSAVSRW